VLSLTYVTERAWTPHFLPRLKNYVAAARAVNESIELRARQKREMAERLRQVAPGLSIASQRTQLLRDAESLEAEASQLEGTAPPRRPGRPQAGEPVVHQQEQAQQQVERSDDSDKPKSWVRRRAGHVPVFESVAERVTGVGHR
jgi:hypothetical protein